MDTSYQMMEEEPNLLEAVHHKLPNTTYKFKVCLIGDGGTGKTTFINKVLNGDFIQKYDATQGAVTKFLTFCIGDNSYVKYEVWDTAGQEKNVGLKDGYYIGAVAGFFFFDANSRETMPNIPKHMRNFSMACGAKDPKMFVLANKIDIVKKMPNLDLIKNQIDQYNGELVQISAKTGFNFEEPFVRLTRKLFNDPNLIISANIDLTPLDINYDILAGDAPQHDGNNAFRDFVPEE